jgi:hypothetical protein
MNTNSLKDLAGLAYQYGPFIFALIFLYNISRWAWRNYDQARAQTPADPKPVTRAWHTFVASFAVAILLVGISVWWWISHGPLYEFTGAIYDLDNNTSVYCDSLYFRVRQHPLYSPNDVPLKDEEFLAVAKHPFNKGDRFTIEVRKDQTSRGNVTLEYDPEAVDSNFSLDFNNGVYQLHSLATPRPVAEEPGNWIPSFTAYAQSPNQTAEARVSPSQRNSSQQTNLKDVNISTIENTQASVGARILALENLYRMDPAPIIAFIQRGASGATFAAGVLDLTRHSDPELAYWAQSLAKKLDLESFVRKGLQSSDADTRYDAKMVLEHFDASQADNLISEMGKVPDKSKLGVRDLALVPTNFPEGDRYYMQVAWDDSNKTQAHCVDEVFEDWAGDSAIQKQPTPSQSSELIYSLDKSQVTAAAAEVNRCGATAKFVHPPQSGGPKR